MINNLKSHDQVRTDYHNLACNGTSVINGAHTWGVGDTVDNTVYGSMAKDIVKNFYLQN